MQYELIFDPGLPVIPEEFVESWNRDGEASRIADAETSLQPATQSTYKTSVTADTMLVVLNIDESLESTVTPQDICALIQKSLKTQGVEEPVDILEVVQPDGSILYFARIKRRR